MAKVQVVDGRMLLSTTDVTGRSGRVTRAPRKAWSLASLCLCVLAVLIDTSIMNVTLPTLVRALGASTRDLQWIVDAYNLTFAALVLAAGSLADRYGRRRALLCGLGVLALCSALGAHAASAGWLIAARTGMGIGAAIVFPATLSIISNVFTERQERARAIGIWGAMTGVGVALGPITGGWLLEHFWWGSVLLVMVPVALLAGALTFVLVPESSDPTVPKLDLAGLLLSIATVGLLVVTIIEAPDSGWTSGRTLGGFAAAAVFGALFAVVEARQRAPMLDVRLFANLRFTAASGAVTVAFFALFGFIFLVTQYFQFVMGYSAFSAGLRLIPVAISVGVGAIVGTRIAVRAGNRVVVTFGLLSMTVAFVWIALVAAEHTSYLVIVGQMVLLAGGLGLTSAPATESIMGAVPAEKAGIGSAMNDATRELGGTLGVAVIGSVFASIYTDRLDHAAIRNQLPPVAQHAWRESIGAALAVAQRARQVAGARAATAVAHAAKLAFLDGMSAGCFVAAGVSVAGAALVAHFLPARPNNTDGANAPDASDPLAIADSLDEIERYANSIADWRNGDGAA
jgi:EmrB/QacA subfamily drug resistance transporter